MKLITLQFMAFTLLSLACMGQQQNKLAKSKTAGAKGKWQTLFDGKTTRGWHSYGQTDVGTAWNVQDGALHVKPGSEGGSGGGDLVTNNEYADFHLKLEWKIAKNGNSGVIFYIHENKEKYPQTYNTGLEMQVLDNDGHPDGKIHKHRAGDLYDLIPCTKETVKPVGEWNQAEIVSKGGNLNLFLNGTKVVTTTLWSEEWKQMVAASKFKTMQDFGTYKSGKISLQNHGNEVWYRNVMIRAL